jgi:hypothetical protein
MNTFCLIQENKNALNEKSCLGTLSKDQGFLIWTIKKKDIDIALKDKNLNANFEV